MISRRSWCNEQVLRVLYLTMEGWKGFKRSTRVTCATTKFYDIRNLNWGQKLESGIFLEKGSLVTSRANLIGLGESFTSLHDLLLGLCASQNYLSNTTFLIFIAVTGSIFFRVFALDSFDRRRWTGDFEFVANRRNRNNGIDTPLRWLLQLFVIMSYRLKTIRYLVGSMLLRTIETARSSHPWVRLSEGPHFSRA
jgi:hypothetical protein